MTPPPERPKLYHITHVENLPGILADGGLLSDRAMLERGNPVHIIGMSAIKRRRVEELVVSCHPGTTVGDYVPFYFCPRSIMLYVIHKANHPELTYRGGQGPIIHLEADLRSVVEWAEATASTWAFTLSNAGARYVEFRARMDELHQLDWSAIEARDFRAPDVKEGKQAEFLVCEWFPFYLVERIGVASSDIRILVTEALTGANHQPAIEHRPDWYF